MEGNDIPNALIISTLFKPGRGETDSNACILCQKPIKDWRTASHVHCVEGTIALIIPAEQAYDHEAADMGWWPIGPECAKRIPAEYIKRAS